MAKGPLMPPWMRQVVVETYLQMEIEAARAPTAKEVHARILEIQGKRTKPIPLPGLRWVQDILTKHREPLEMSRDLDRPWSLGTGAHLVPPEAIPDLLELWRICLTEGMQLTRRQAVWASRLRTFLAMTYDQERWWLGTDIRPLRLYRWACIYAGNEISSEILGQVPNTQGLDAFMILDPVVRQAALESGAIPPISNESVSELLERGGPVVSHVDLDNGRSYREMLEELLEGNQFREQLQGIDLQFTGTEWQILGVWLSSFSRRGEEWPNMTKDERDQAIVELALEIKSSMTVNNGEGALLARPSEELLKKIGYRN